MIQASKRWEFAMPIPLRTDFDASLMRLEARRSKDGPQARRLLALAAIYEGASRTEAARIGGVTVQMVRDWVERFNECGPSGLLDRKAPGQPSIMSAVHREALAAVIESGPTLDVDGVVRWRLSDLMKWLKEKHEVSISLPTLSRELRALGYRKLSARPRHHAQDPDAIENFQKGGSQPSWQRSKRVSRTTNR